MWVLNNHTIISLIFVPSYPQDVPPVLMTTKFYLCNIYRDGIYFLALLNGEVSK